jgi:iron complex outermembrane receptor protein
MINQKPIYCEVLVGISLYVLANQAFSQAVPTLAPVVVQAPFPTDNTTAGPVEGYQALTASASTRTQTPINEIPQAIDVIPRSLMDDQVNTNVTQALQNASAVQGTNPLQTPAYDGTRIRGFVAEQWVDGLTNYYNAGNRDSLVNVERIEVLKGPNGILYGGGAGSPIGGAVNIVTKKPRNEVFGVAGVTAGNYGYLQPYFDVNSPLNKEGSVLFRMTGEYLQAASQIGVLNTNSWQLNPTLVFTNNADTKLTLQGTLSSWRQQEYQGLPATGTLTGNFKVNPNLFVGPNSIPNSYSTANSLTATLDHTFNDRWSVNAQARIGETSFREYSQSLFGADGFSANRPLIGPSTWGLWDVDLKQSQQEQTYNVNLIGKFKSSWARTTAVFGADFSRLTDNGVMLADPLMQTVNLQTPAFSSFQTPVQGPYNTFFNSANTYTTSGVYAQLQSTLFDSLHILLGGRYADLNIESVTLPPAWFTSRTDTTSTTKFLPRAGAVFDITKGFSIYASYSEGMKGNPFVLYEGKPQPQTSTQQEAGIKFNFSNGLSGSAAVFQISNDGVPVSQGIFARADGQQRSTGFETNLLWQPTSNWQVWFNYANVNAEQVNNAGAALAGNQLNAVPNNSGRLWVNYRFTGQLKGWRAGAGVYAASSAYIDAANLYKTPGYATLDGSVAYEADRYTVSLSVKNLTDRQYYTPYNYFGGRVAPGQNRTVFANVALKF